MRIHAVHRAVQDHPRRKRQKGFAFLSFFVLILVYAVFSNREIAQAWSRRNDENAKNTDYSYYNMGDFETLWPRLQSHLCPNQRPNLRYIQNLTRLAWDRLVRDELVGDLAGSQDFVWLDDFGQEVWRKDYGVTLYLHPEGKQALIYSRLYKCGNNEIRGWMENILASQGGTFQDSSFGPGIENWLQNTTAPSCIVTAIRDPISHFLSGYNEIEFRIRTFPIAQKHVQRATNRATTNMSAFFHSQSTASPEVRFATFVKNILEGNKLMAVYPYLDHVYPMMRILSNLEEYNLTLTGYLPTLKDLTKSWPTFVEKTCPNTLPESFSSSSMSLANRTIAAMSARKRGRHQHSWFSQGHASSSDPYGVHAAAKRVWKQEGGVAEALCIWHLMDYACWPALETIPQFCQSTYVSIVPIFLPQHLFRTSLV